MRRGLGRVAALTVIVVALAPVWASLGSTASADEISSRTYVGSGFGDGGSVLPTRYEHQSKLWFHDNAWWALMLDPADSSARVFELLPDHTWRSTGTMINSSPSDLGDALLDGETLYVVSRGTAEDLQFRRLIYDAGARNFVAATPDPVVITQRGGRSPASVAKDTTGRLWVTFAATSAIYVAYSGDDGLTWTEPFVPAVPGGASVAPDEVSTVITFAGMTGVMWSDQVADAVYFALHRDRDPDEEWTREIAVAGSGLADNHINVKVAGSGPTATVLAAIKTSQGDSGEEGASPLLLVLARAPDGVWTSAVGATLGDRNDSPILQVDETNEALYLLAEGPGGIIYAKRSPLSELAFSPGNGDPFIFGGPSRVVEATGSKQAVSERTGLVVLASGAGDHRYNHAELAIPVPEDLPAGANRADFEPPTTPEEVAASVSASGSVIVSWSASNDGTRWYPAADSVPVEGYTLYRDGAEVGTTTQTSYGDVPPESGRSYEYSVVAVDRAGNPSAPSTVLVAIPRDRISTSVALELSVGGIAAMAIIIALHRKHVRDRARNSRARHNAHR